MLSRKTAQSLAQRRPVAQVRHAPQISPIDVSALLHIGGASVNIVESSPGLVVVSLYEC